MYESFSRRRSPRLIAVALTVLLLANFFVGVASADPVAAPDYRPVDPARLADTRAGRPTVDGSFSGTGAVTPGSPLLLTVLGRGGVPASGVVAVALNVTVTGSTLPGYLTAYPSGASRPLASNINFDRGSTTANSIVVKLGGDNRAAFYSSVPAHVIIDVAGYFTSGGVDAITPARLADTRPGRSTIDGQAAGSGPVAPSSPLQLTVSGRGGVPGTGVTAVLLNVVAVAPRSEGYVTAYPSGTSRPVASNLNFVAGQTVANSVVASLGSGGKVAIYTSATANVVVDVLGYFTSGSSFVAMSPARFADTRSGRTTVAGPTSFLWRDSNGVGPIGTGVGTGDRIDILINDRGVIPSADIGAVVLNVTAIQPTAAGYVTVFPLGSERPTASSLNYTRGQTVPNMVVAKVGRGGGISIYNSSPSAHLVVDVLGYLPGVSTEGSPTTWTALLRDSVDMPMSYDRCKPIRYQINPAGAPSGWISDVVTALGKISEATGLTFQRLSDTSEVPTLPRESRDSNGSLKPVLIAFTSETVIPGLGGSVVGRGGSNAEWSPSSVTFTPEQFVTGQAYFDYEEDMPSGFGGDSFGMVALHELGHVVGLGHVANDNEIMNDFVIERSGYFGPGDLEGLATIYRTQSCPGSPATFPPV